MPNYNSFLEAVKVITQNFEGGYYHPDMQKDGRMKPNPVYKNSGETMFGIDRKAGAGIAAYNPGAWRSFWDAIDRSGASKLWKWNYRGGNLYGQLYALAADIMLPYYKSLEKKYLTAKTIAAVDASPLLTIHIIYGSWNGAGWFQKFAKVLNDSTAKNETTETQIKKSIAARLNSGNGVIIKSGEKIGKLIGTNTLGNIGKTLPPVLIAIFVIVLIYFYA